MVAGLHQRRGLFRSQGRADRQAAAQRLGDGDQVGLDPAGLIGPQRACPSHTTLDLVADQQRVVLVTDRAQSLQKDVRRRMDAPLALYSLDEHTAGLDLGDQIARGLQVVKGRKVHAGHQGPKGLLVFGLGRERQRTHRPPVKRMLESDKRRLVSVRLAPLARKLDARLDGLGARVAKVDPVRRAALDQVAGQHGLRTGVVQVGDVQQLGHLILDRIHDDGMPVPQGVDCDPTQKVQVGLAGRVIDVRPFSSLQDKIGTVVGVHNVLFFQSYDLLRVHSHSPPDPRFGNGST